MSNFDLPLLPSFSTNNTNACAIDNNNIELVSIFLSPNVLATASRLSFIIFISMRKIINVVALYATLVIINFTKGDRVAEYLTCKDISKKFNVKLRTVYVWIRRGKIGNHWLPSPDMVVDGKPLWLKETIEEASKART